MNVTELGRQKFERQSSCRKVKLENLYFRDHGAETLSLGATAVGAMTLRRVPTG